MWEPVSFFKIWVGRFIVATDASAYALSTRTGAIEAEALATRDPRHGPQG